MYLFILTLRHDVHDVSYTRHISKVCDLINCIETNF